MNRLPVMVGFGGINPAGRVSFDHAYHRLVIDALDTATQDRTYNSLASIMGLEDPSGKTPESRQYIDEHTLIRRIELFDPNKVNWQSAAQLKGVTIGHADNAHADSGDPEARAGRPELLSAPPRRPRGARWPSRAALHVATTTPRRAPGGAPRAAFRSAPTVKLTGTASTQAILQLSMRAYVSNSLKHGF